MRIARSTTINSGKRGQTNSNSNRNLSSSGMDRHNILLDDGSFNDDPVVDFVIDEIPVDKVESLLGISFSTNTGGGKTVISSSLTSNPGGTNTGLPLSESITKQSKKPLASSSSTSPTGKRKGDHQSDNRQVSETQQLVIPPPTSPNSISGRVKANKVPKLTLRLGMSPGVTLSGSNSTIETSNLSAGSLLGSTPSQKSAAMKVRTSARLSQLASSANAASAEPAATINGPTTAAVTVTSSHQQGGNGGPQTPGTPSDHGANTPNPPTPGNTSSTGMVNSPHQYVTITVDGEGVPGESVGGSSSYVTYVEGSTDHSTIYAAAAAVNGQTMAYPVYSVGDSSGMYTTSSTQYYSSGSGTTPGVTYTQGDGVGESRDDNIHDISSAAAPGVLTSADINSILSGGSGDSSVMSSSPEMDALHQNHQAFLDGGVYMVPSSSSNNNNSGASEGEGTPLLSHATRISPATKRGGRGKRKSPPALEKIQYNKLEMEEFDSDVEDDGFEFGTDDSQNEDGMMNSFLSESELKALTKLYPSITNLGGSGSSGHSGASSIAKACPQSVQWLLDNYETAEGVSLPRSTLYSHYLRHCSDTKLDPVNAASFGKLIRSVFLGLRTRRLGTRGNSKYHYYGIRLKPSSPLNNIPEEFSPQSNGHGTGGMGSRSGGGSLSHHAGHSTNNSGNAGIGGNGVGVQSSGAGGAGMNKRLKTCKTEGFEGQGPHVNGFTVGDSMAIQQYLGDTGEALDDFPNPEFSHEFPEGILEDDLLIFKTLYREHCKTVLEVVATFQLGQIETMWRIFWRNAGEGAEQSNLDYEKLLPKPKLMLLCQMKGIQHFCKEADYNFYQKVVGILLPDVLRPIPSSMTQGIRNFAKTMENWMSNAMNGYPDDIVIIKVAAVSSLAQTLRRYTSLNHLAQAARAVLQNQNQITQMLSDLNRVDFNNVEEQASWVCGCDGDFVPNLEQDFKATLAQQQTLEQWGSWLEGVVDRVIQPHINTPRFVQAARHFLLKWSFYSSLIIRDLTLRSAASFGSFHLLRLLYDEYMFYLVEHRVAQVSGVVPIAVIGKSMQLSPFGGLTSINSLNPQVQMNVNGHRDVGSAHNVGLDSMTPTVSPDSHGSNGNNITSFANNLKPEPKRVKHFLTS